MTGGGHEPFAFKTCANECVITKNDTANLTMDL